MTQKTAFPAIGLSTQKLSQNAQPARVSERPSNSIERGGETPVALEAFQSLARYRASGNRFTASCPTSAHTTGDKHPSLSGVILQDKILITCHAGCRPEAILAALGLAWGSLFTDSKSNPMERRHAERQRAVRDGFRKWREDELARIGLALRERDSLVAVATKLATEDQMWNTLEAAYRGYSKLEYQLEILRCGSDAEALEVYRHG